MIPKMNFLEPKSLRLVGWSLYLLPKYSYLLEFGYYLGLFKNMNFQCPIWIYFMSDFY